MAGVTDQPFRKLCRRLGAALTPSEMLSANPALWDSPKNRLRRCHDGEDEPRIVQIASADPEQMAEAARLNVAFGAQVIDINMGCPAKKVLKKAAGSALLRDEPLVRSILQAVTAAVEVPVTLKIRTGWCPATRNGPTIARMAQDCGVQALAVHGRTRACLFQGSAEYDTIAAIKESVSIPVFANGDIDSPQKARFVLDYTRADGVMIGRAAQERPWLFRDIAHYLEHGVTPPPLPVEQRQAILLAHVRALHDFYGAFRGVLVARKHVAWQLRTGGGAESFRRFFNRLENPRDQVEALLRFFGDSSKNFDDDDKNKVLAA